MNQIYDIKDFRETLDMYKIVNKYQYIYNWWDDLDKNLEQILNEELYISIKNNNLLEFTKSIIKHNIDVTMCDNLLLKNAICNKSYSIINYLTEIIDINFSNGFAVKIACEFETDFLKYIINLGGNIRIDDDFCICYAILCNSLENVIELIDNGADINCRNGLPLYIANDKSIESSILDYLIKQGVNINNPIIINKYISNGSYHQLKTLLKYGIDVNLINIKNYVKFLSDQDNKYERLKITKILVQYGFNISQINNIKLSKKSQIFTSYMSDFGIDSNILCSILY
ncbi:ankyrin repeat protein [Megavirus baoshan]|uniref:Ankyrin repeat protein n=1 Tax=Megavirus baoshan TaxID=2496520 RepID=A0A3S8UY58_9VIRU|nr:ankyrin repeat protein [Megavirus baoshan]AZL89750.1 ankyrin repeat protein [Megavirus baoshan]